MAQAEPSTDPPDPLCDLADRINAIAAKVEPASDSSELRQISTELLVFRAQLVMEEQEEEDDDEEEDEDDDGDAYAEDHLTGREWVPISFMNGSRTFALEIHGAESTIGTLVRTVTWGPSDDEFSAAMVYLPAVSLRELQRPERKKGKG